MNTSNEFTLIPADYFIWNKHELLSFLIRHQGCDIIINTHSEGCCLKSIGLYQLLDLFVFRSVTIETTNAVEYHPVYNIVKRQTDKFFKVHSAVNYSECQQWNKSKVFGALYNRAIWHRIGLASYLKTNYNDISLVNFRANPHDPDQRQLFEVQKLFEFSPESVTNFSQLYDMLPAVIEPIDGYTVGATTIQHTDQLCKFYKDFLIDIVAETFTSGRTFFPTEKTVRPMLMKKPFIAMGPKCFLIHLRQMGFKTFYEFWDEDYDGYGTVERYKRILLVIDSLANKSATELSAMYDAMQEVLEHNYQVLVSQTYNNEIKWVE